MKYKDAFPILGLDPGVPPKLIRDTYHNIAKDPTSVYRHPDIGGDASRFSSLTTAYHSALAYALEERCHLCNGLGTIRHRKGFNEVELTCSLCRGTGLNHGN